MIADGLRELLKNIGMVDGSGFKDDSRLWDRIIRGIFLSHPYY